MPKKTMGAYYTYACTEDVYTISTLGRTYQPSTPYTKESLAKIIIDKHLIWPSVCPDCGGIVEMGYASDYCGCFALTCACDNRYIDTSLCKSGHNDYYFRTYSGIMLSKQHVLFVRTLKELKDAFNGDIDEYLMYKKFLFDRLRCGISCTECGISGLYKICKQYLPHLINRKDKIDIIRFIINHLFCTLNDVKLNGECCSDHAV
jgi:hypothetical protein